MIDRRHLLYGLAATVAATPLRAAPISALGLDASQFGVRPGSPDDQSAVLQKAIDRAAATGAPLALPPGTYRAGGLSLPPGAQLIGIRGATRIAATGARPIVSAARADRVRLDGLVLDGVNARLPDRTGIITLTNGRGVAIRDCDIAASGGNGIALDGVGGEIAVTAIAGVAEAAIFCNDSRGLVIANNRIRDAANNGIVIFRSAPGEDGTKVLDNDIADIRNRSGGSGQYGNGVNAFRAHHVIVRGNRIGACAFSAVRGNAASNIQIVDNACSDLGEVALYSEFGFQGAVISGNTVVGARAGISVTNFNEGGRLAVVQGNLIRDISVRGPVGSDEARGVGISVEADTAVTGNVVENAAFAGLMAGWGKYLRDVAMTGNVVRGCGIGIAVSVAAGAGSAVIASNMISGSRRGAIVGLDHEKPVTGDLGKDGTGAYSRLTISGNRVE